MQIRPIWKEELHNIIFEADTPAGKSFDIALLWIIVLSVVVVMLDSVEAYQARFGMWLHAAEWFFTILFTIEYIVRLVAVRKPLGYAKSFFGLIDLASILPTYLSLFIPGAQSLGVIRAFRLLRIFRVLKLVRFSGEANVLMTAIRGSRHKVTIFLGTVLTIALTIGSAMYFIEGAESGFTSIPRSMYWAIVTITTVGYGDIAPVTIPGQTLASILMLVGYSILAVPTGIMTVELNEAYKQDKLDKMTTQACPDCSSYGHDHDAVYCKYCRGKL
ncbi:ion transporter [Myxococcota bacterium]|nr:ion transporter [Myxococcota bacterium]